MAETRHGKQTVSEGIHIPYQWSYANQAGRTGASGFVAADVGKLALQTDTNTLWMLSATTPTWQPVSTPIQTINVIVDGGGVAITTGVKLDFVIDFACTIQQVTLLADVSGSIVVDLWKAAYSAYPPTVANTITAAALPTITAALKSQDGTLTGWTVAVAAGDTFRLNVNSCSTITRILLSLKVIRS